jgi:hypothetical protein
MYGANMLHAEWAKYMQELVEEKAVIPPPSLFFIYFRLILYTQFKFLLNYN